MGTDMMWRLVRGIETHEKGSFFPKENIFCKHEKQWLKQKHVESKHTAGGLFLKNLIMDSEAVRDVNIQKRKKEFVCFGTTVAGHSVVRIQTQC